MTFPWPAFVMLLRFVSTPSLLKKTRLAKRLLAMAAIASCAHYGCGWTQLDYAACYFDELAPLALVSRAQTSPVPGPASRSVYWTNQCQMHILSVQMLRELQRLRPAIVATHLTAPRMQHLQYSPWWTISVCTDELRLACKTEHLAKRGHSTDRCNL